MALESSSARRVMEFDKSGGWKPHRGSVRFRVFGRVLACLIGAVFVAEALVVERSPARDDDRMWLVRGADGVGTLSLAISSQAALIATADTSGRASLWDEATESISRDIDSKCYAISVAFTSDGRFLAIGGLESGITLWPVEHGTTEQAEVMPLRRVKVMAFSPDGRFLAAASANSTQVVIWDRAKRREKLILKCRSPILSLAFSPDSRYLAAGEQADRGSVYLWDVETGWARFVVYGSCGPVPSIAVSPDGAVLATVGMYDKGIRLWDMRSGELCRVIAGHPHGTNAVAFSPDGGALASAGNDGKVRLWSAATGEQRATLDGRSIRLSHVAFSPDGRSLFAVGSSDNDIRVWDLPGRSTN